MAVWTLAKRTLVVALLFVYVCGIGGNVVAAPSSAAIADPAQLADERAAIQSGAKLEKTNAWLGAVEHYEKTLKRWPENEKLKRGLRRSKIQFSIERRYSDGSFDASLLRQSRQEALGLFDEVLEQVTANYVDSISPSSYVAHGTESLYYSLSNPKFLKKHLPHVDPNRIDGMRRRLREILHKNFWNKPIAHRAEARRVVEQVCTLCESVMGLPSNAVVMEYIFGGCNALDDYSSHLTSDRLEDLYGNIEGEFVGLGIEMKAETGKGLLLVNVLPKSPAKEGGMRSGEWIVAIGGTDSRFLSTDEAARLLRGRSGTSVRLRLESPESGKIREGVFHRRLVQVASIPEARIIDASNGIGYIRMTGFQKSSASELDDVLNRLRRQGMRTLIWDVRGNPGGLLQAAVEVLDRFIRKGVLVSTRGRISNQNMTYSAYGPGTWDLPLVLLVDGDSASASEIVAGAIIDHKRGTVVGRQTYGKWSVQTIFHLRGATGLRLTTAKFYSPLGHTRGKVGVRPDVVVKLPQHFTGFRGTFGKRDADADPDLRKALEILRRQITRR